LNGANVGKPDTDLKRRHIRKQAFSKLIILES
jgi:hypothetical protein